MLWYGAERRGNSDMIDIVVLRSVTNKTEAFQSRGGFLGVAFLGL